MGWDGGDSNDERVDFDDSNLLIQFARSLSVVLIVFKAIMIFKCLIHPRGAQPEL